MKRKWNKDSIKKCVDNYDKLKEDILVYIENCILFNKETNHYISNLWFDFKDNEIIVELCTDNFLEADSCEIYEMSLNGFIEWSVK